MTVPSHLCDLTVKCFQQAEEALQSIIREKYHDLNEETITHLFGCELAFIARKVNREEGWSNALRRDLSSAFGYLVSPQQFGTEFDHLFCDVHFHNHRKEAKTGGDFGLFTSLPLFENSYGMGRSLNIEFRDQALLVQAKLGRWNRSYGKLKVNQVKHLEQNKGFSAMLLYGYNDAAHSVLSQFSWQSCKNQDVKAIDEWLKKSAPPAPNTSAQIVGSLFAGDLGTSDKTIIEKTILAKQRPSFEFRIRWPDGRAPNSTVSAADYIEVKDRLRVRQ